jgi:hypothetical protein
MAGNTTSGARRRAQHQQRLAWLQARPELLARLPGANDDVTPQQSSALDEALRALMLVRLYAPTSIAASVRWGIRMLVSEIRAEHTTGQDPMHRYSR